MVVRSAGKLDISQQLQNTLRMPSDFNGDCGAEWTQNVHRKTLALSSTASLLKVSITGITKRHVESSARICRGGSSK